MVPPPSPRLRPHIHLRAMLTMPHELSHLRFDSHLHLLPNQHLHGEWSLHRMSGRLFILHQRQHLHHLQRWILPIQFNYLSQLSNRMPNLHLLDHLHLHRLSRWILRRWHQLHYLPKSMHILFRCLDLHHLHNWILLYRICLLAMYNQLRCLRQ